MRGEFLLGLNPEVRDGAGVEAGDEVDVNIELDTEPRDVEVPADLVQALEADRAAQDALDRLAFTHRKEFARRITEAERSETRNRRVAKTLRLLHEGETRS